MNETYTHLLQGAQTQSAQLRRRINQYGLFRLMSFLVAAASVYYYFYSYPLAIWVGLFAVLFYILLVKKQDKLKDQHQLQEVLVKANQRELEFLQGNFSQFPTGSSFISDEHPYSTDLDLFGSQSLFQQINRSGTHIGQAKLGSWLLDVNGSVGGITTRQAAVAELKPLISWRQLLHGYGQMHASFDEAAVQVKNWKNEAVRDFKVARIFSFLVPSLLLIVGILCALTEKSLFENFFYLLIGANLLATAFHAKAIKKELVVTAGISKSLNSTTRLFQHIQSQKFESEGLQRIQKKLGDEPIQAIKELSIIMGRLESVQNGFGVLIMSGLTQYHLHALISLWKWKQNYGHRSADWFDAIAEMEALSSLAQLGFNNESWAFATFNSEGNQDFLNLGHPLIPANQRINNSINFKKGQLVILTGSNMSGKSTFLRTVGVNMVLAKCGGPVCAQAMSVDPIHLYAHMKVADSLAGGQSYFFAEVNRLKFIKTNLEQQSGFVLLDEILRGTNSDDKKIGTIEFLKKLHQLGATGIIATHDLGVCKLADEFPDQMINMRFEVEIRGDELVFDYKLRSGVCENKNASVILRKSGII